ncbi:MAG: carboxypeptidase-like regulatory domain-containing protein, partial [Bacteroidota bacterium]
RNVQRDRKARSTEADNGRLILLNAISEDDQWVDLLELPFNNADYSVGQATFSPGGDTLYFVSDMPGGHGSTDIYRSTRQGENWSEPENLGPTVNTPGRELFPHAHPSGQLFFASDGHAGLGGLDLFVAFPFAERFDGVQALGAPLSSPSDDFALIVHPNGQSGYFASNRPQGIGGDDLYHVRIHQPIAADYRLAITVVDEASKQPLSGARVSVSAPDVKPVFEAITDSTGFLSVAVDPHTKYLIKVTMDGYFAREQQFISRDFEFGPVANTTVPLTKDPGFSLTGTIYESGTEAGISSVMLTISDLQRDETNVAFTNSQGNFVNPLSGYRLKDTLRARIQLDRMDYLTRTVVLDTVITKTGAVSLSEFLKKEVP